MKIAIDLTALADNFSGIERYAFNISKELIKSDNINEYILIIKNFIEPSFKECINKSNIKFEVGYGRNRIFFSQIKLTKILYKIKADRYLFLAFPGPILFKREGIINTIHDLTAWDYPDTMKVFSRIYFKIAIRNAIRVSSNILTVSKFSKKRLFEKFHKTNIDIIYNGISEEFIKNRIQVNDKSFDEIKKKYSLPEKYIMCLCTLEPRKNIKLLVQVFIELKENNKIGDKLVLVGRKGWKVEELLKTINQKYKDDILITGFVEDSDLPYLYKMASCFIFPSLYEGFGIPIIEAMYMKVPVICSNTSSIPEVVDGNGILFESNSHKDLEEKILFFINAEKKYINELVENAYEKATYYNWKNESQKLYKILSNDM
ncbi:glycosyltransferase family 4 protein [Clostridium butyricum]